MSTELGGESLLRAALEHDAPGYFLGEQLARMRPELHLVEGDHLLDLQPFADAGKCTLEVLPHPHPQFDTRWLADGDFRVRPKTAWLRVTWEGASYEAITLSYHAGYYENERYYVLGRDKAACHALIDAVCKWNNEVRGEVLVFNGSCFTKNTKLYEAVMRASFEQLTLQGSLAAEIRDDFAQFLGARATYEEHGVPWKRGALFIGPPGNGKTLCVKALIKHLAVPCIYVQSFECPGEPVQGAIEQVFRRARETAPCIIVLEDIDSLLTDASRSFFLNELDGFATNTGVITIATTNHPDKLDAAIVERPSRFDRKYHFELPEKPTRAKYVAAWNARLKPALQLSDTACAKLVELTDGFSFAYIQELFVSSMMRWMTTRDDGGIAKVAVAQVESLREQMISKPTHVTGFGL